MPYEAIYWGGAFRFIGWLILIFLLMVKNFFLLGLSVFCLSMLYNHFSGKAKKTKQVLFLYAAGLLIAFLLFLGEFTPEAVDYLAQLSPPLCNLHYLFPFHLFDPDVMDACTFNAATAGGDLRSCSGARCVIYVVEGGITDCEPISASVDYTTCLAAVARTTNNVSICEHADFEKQSEKVDCIVNVLRDHPNDADCSSLTRFRSFCNASKKTIAEICGNPDWEDVCEWNMCVERGIGRWSGTININYAPYSLANCVAMYNKDKNICEFSSNAEKCAEYVDIYSENVSVCLNEVNDSMKARCLAVILRRKLDYHGCWDSVYHESYECGFWLRKSTTSVEEVCSSLASQKDEALCMNIYSVLSSDCYDSDADCHWLCIHELEFLRERIEHTSWNTTMCMDRILNNTYMNSS